MKYLIYANMLDAKERNHEASCFKQSPKWKPLSYSQTPYWWATKTHPDTGEVALCIPDEDLTDTRDVYSYDTDLDVPVITVTPLLTAAEIADLDDALTSDWTPTPTPFNP